LRFIRRWSWARAVPEPRSLHRLFASRRTQREDACQRRWRRSGRQRLRERHHR
jgi:hypothetical protein